VDAFGGECDNEHSMSRLEVILFVLGAAFQVAAMVFAARMMGKENVRRPWIALFAALLLMLSFRVFRVMVTGSPSVLSSDPSAVPWDAKALSLLGTLVPLGVSFLIFISLLSVRRLALAERESTAAAAHRAIERDAAEEQARASGQKLKLVSDALPSLIAYVDREQRYRFNNRAYEAWLCQPREYFLGKHLRETWDEPAYESIRPHVEAALSGKLVNFQLNMTFKDGVARDVDVTYSPDLAPDGTVNGFGVLVNDVTERKQAERLLERTAAERQRLLESEREARGEVERVSRIKDEFLATLSHELRTPLNAILGWAQLLRMGRLDDDERAQGLETIERNARAQTQIIEDLLDMSRIISGKIRLDVQRVDLAAVLNAAIDSVRPSAEAKSIRLSKLLDTRVAPISGDPARMQQVVWNLLSNAIKFTPKGGNVQVILERVNSHIEVVVADNGEGIQPGFLAHIFERFRQQDSSTTRRHAGLGLGLSIARQLVELHGGTISVKSAGLGQGATFTVMLPLPAMREETEPPDSGAAAPGHDSICLSGVRVLVVDDEPDARELIRQVLRDHDADVVTADSPAEAMAILKQQRPTVLISDIGMPGKDGYDLMRSIRALSAEDGGETPAVALTAFARSEDRTRAMLAGYQVHISKPFEPRELVATLASLAGRTGRPVART
jgi:PAS domain S-box-containing protein